MSADVLNKQRVAAAIETAEEDLVVWIGLGASDSDYIVENFDDHSFGLTLGDLRALIAAAKGGAA